MSEGQGRSDHLPDPGWYHDPEVEGHQRYWDGTSWVGTGVPVQAATPLTTPATPPSPSPPLADTVGPPVAAPPPPAPPPPVPGAPRRSSGLSGGAWIALIVGLMALLLFGGCAFLVVGVRASPGPDAEFAEVEIARPVPPVPMTTTTGPPEPMTEEGVATTGVPGGDDRSNAVTSPYGSPMTLLTDADSETAALWNVVIGPPSDITDAVNEINPLDAEPVPGISHVMVPVELALAESLDGRRQLDGVLDRLQPRFEGGASAARYEPGEANADGAPFGCSAAIEPMSSTGDIGVGETVFGVICFTVPTADLDHPDSRISVWIDGQPPLAWGN